MAILHLLLLALVPNWSTQEYEHSLAGEWQVRLDPKGEGQLGQWFTGPIAGTEISLPGTTDLAGIGYPLDFSTMSYGTPFTDSEWPGRPAAERLDEAGHLVRRHMYLGKAWYQRTIQIPETWHNRRVVLELERVMWQSDVWVDDQYFGSKDSLTTAHRFDLGVLAPGNHRLTIRVGNGQIHELGILGHAFGPETQSRWNGIIGEMKLTAKPHFFVERIRVDAPADPKQLRANVVLHNLSDGQIEGDLTLSVTSIDGTQLLTRQTYSCSSDQGAQTVEAELPITTAIQTWSEFEPNRYLLTAELKSTYGSNKMEIPFGFRSIERSGKQILLNGQPIFLRGTLDCAVYPRTGHPPTNLEEWRTVLSTIRDHGFNHVRFHTWCPPRAAFDAADELGIYLCPETPFWVDNWTSKIGLKPKLLGFHDGVSDYVRREIQNISDAYGNHPSFTFFCIGNEFGMDSDWQLVQDLVREAKRYDDRHLHSGSTARRRVAADDYWVTHRTGQAVRGIGPAHSNWDYRDAIAETDLPVIAHETGQRPVFPDYASLLPKFTGPLLPLNYQRLQRELNAAGLAGQTNDFAKASAKFQMVQYKAEHEAMLRTPDFGGYQLLMLNDFTGQSEALVGILDPFWQSKGVFQDADVRQWNSRAVPLVRIESYIWTSEQTFEAEVDVAIFDSRDWSDCTPVWELRSDDGRFHIRQPFDGRKLQNRGMQSLGSISAPLTAIQEATALTLTVDLAGGEPTSTSTSPSSTPARNSWVIWVYPPASKIESVSSPPSKDGILISERLDSKTLQQLKNGAKVLLLAHGTKNPRTKQTQFAAVYWSAGWWGDAFSHLGILCDPQHPAFSGFPNDGHSDWQWYELTQNATTFRFDLTGDGFRLLVQLVPDFHHNQLLGQVFECKVGRGRLLVCGYDLASDLTHRHAARQFRGSLLDYMRSKDFRPSHELKLAMLEALLERQP